MSRVFSKFLGEISKRFAEWIKKQGLYKKKTAPPVGTAFFIRKRKKMRK